MAPEAQKVLQDILRLYKGLTTQNKMIIGAVLAVAIAGFVYLLSFSDFTEFDYLYTNISDKDAGDIVEHLKKNKIPYKLGEGSIMAPKKDVRQLRLSLAAEGLPRGEGVGFEIFENQKLGTSKYVQELNYKRAMEGELSRTVASLEKVENARVHLVTPKKALFKEDEVPASASVVVRLAGNKELDANEVKSIVHLVSSSVEGLSAKNITIIDSNGNMLSRAMGDEEEQIWGSSPLEYKNKLERDLASRVEEVVSHVVGLGKVVAKVTVELDFKKEEKTEELFDPDQVVVRSEKRSKENRQNDETINAGGAPGAQANLPQNQDGTGQQSSATERDRTMVNYEINKVVRHTVRAAGDVKRVSVAVLVDGSYKPGEVAEDAEDDAKPEDTYVPRTPEELEKIRALVMRVVGYNENRGDEVEVSNVPFETSALEEYEIEPSFLERYDFIPQLLRYGILLVLAIVLVFFLFKPLVEWVINYHEEERLRELDREQEDIVKSMEEQLSEVRGTIETSTVELKKRVQELADMNPDMVVAVFRTWLNVPED